jgi:hypothetical protein
VKIYPYLALHLPVLRCINYGDSAGVELIR